MPFVVIAHYRARKGAEKQVAESLRAMVEPTRAEPGNLVYRVCRSADDPALFALFEEYSDADAFQAHLDSDHFARWLREGTLPYLEERQRHDLVPLGLRESSRETTSSSR